MKLATLNQPTGSVFFGKRFLCAAKALCSKGFYFASLEDEQDEPLE
jgi:hypothetical protein